MQALLTESLILWVSGAERCKPSIVIAIANRHVLVLFSRKLSLGTVCEIDRYPRREANKPCKTNKRTPPISLRQSRHGYLKISTGDKRRSIAFSCLYRSILAPALASDIYHILFASRNTFKSVFEARVSRIRRGALLLAGRQL